MLHQLGIFAVRLLVFLQVFQQSLDLEVYVLLVHQEGPHVTELDSWKAGVSPPWHVASPTRTKQVSGALGSHDAVTPGVTLCERIATDGIEAKRV